MAKLSKKPDFVVDQHGNVEDVRHDKFQTKKTPKKKFKNRTGARSQKEDASYKIFTNQPKKKNKIRDFTYHQKDIKEVGGCLLSIIGVLLVIGGIGLVIGNRSGEFLTFPFAGLITSSVGFAIIAAGLNKLEGK